MRVAHVGNYEPESANGVDQALASYAMHLRTEGFGVELWNFTPEVSAVEERRVEGVTILDLPFYRRRWQNVIRLPKKTRSFVEQRSQEIDLLHLHAVFRAENLWAAHFGAPYVVTPHVGYTSRVLNGRHRLLKRAWFFLWERSYLNRARAVHAVSLPEANELRNLGIKAPVVYAPKGIDDTLLRRVTPKPHEAPAWIFLGRLAVDHKGLDLLVMGYALLYKQRGGDLPPLVLAGPDHRGGKEQLVKLARRLGIAESIRFEGPVFGEDKWTLLAQARLFVHTSRWDTIPFAVLEALALGRPVLVTPETWCAQHIEEHAAGWVVEGTPKDIARGLRATLEASPHDLDAAGERARALVRENFSWPPLIRRLARIYSEAVE